MNIEVEFSKKQALAFQYLNDDITTEILFGGSAGGGKSYLGAAWIIINCINYPGTRWLMGRSKLKALKQTTLKTFFEICSNWNLNQDHYNYNQSSGEITFYNGSVVILKDLFTYPSDPNFDSLGSLEITGAFIDEVNQVSEKAKNIVASRMRYKLEEFNLIPKLFMSCNPAKNWTFTEFYKKQTSNTIEEYKIFIQSLVTDNPNISAHYISQLKKLDRISRDRLLHGKWEYADADALINYDDISLLFNDTEYKPNGKPNDYYLSIDVARLGKDKAVILLWFKLDIIKIYTFDKIRIDTFNEIITNIKKEHKIPNRNIVIDTDGIGGGVTDYFRGCQEFNNNGKPTNSDYQNIKTECYFKLSNKINNNEINIYGDIKIEIKESIIEELTILKRVDYDKDGKIKLISKDNIKKEIGRSPDYSDAMMMRMVFLLKQNKFVYKII